MNKRHFMGGVKGWFIAVLVLAATFGCSDYCHAAEWEWIISNDTYNWEIDKSSAKLVDFKFAGRNAVCWIKASQTDGSYSIGQWAFRNSRQGQKEALVMSSTDYDSRGNVIGRHIVTNEPFDFQYNPIVPDSIAELLFDTAFSYAK
ncbi:hypothetical protein D081_2016 [Anaerovibrio sp. JC8]|uniref:hypothetical protein n=1 Tax=Anaerovibrio sp. JC8 TaxID=1240085 RepID=UPI000A0BC6A4|nr:hypothetical protein [Anaerovibrio sp. JC8]ORT99287.1 hypothetical protein D081_2016 [Anaerovibrio sp. JC8]